MIQAERPKVEFQGMRKWLKKGEYIISTISEDGTIWTFSSNNIPIFDFRTTKIFQAQESGMAEITGVERGEDFFFSIKGVKVSKVYDFYPMEEHNE